MSSIASILKENQLLRTQLGQKQTELSLMENRLSLLEKKIEPQNFSDDELVQKYNDLLEENDRLKKKMAYLHKEVTNAMMKIRELEASPNVPEKLEEPKKKISFLKKILHAVVLRSKEESEEKSP